MWSSDCPQIFKGISWVSDNFMKNPGIPRKYLVTTRTQGYLRGLKVAQEADEEVCLFIFFLAIDRLKDMS